MAVLTAVTRPVVEPEVPDARDPVTVAAFTALLVGLVAPPPLVTPLTDDAPVDGAAPVTPGPLAIPPAAVPTAADVGRPAVPDSAAEATVAGQPLTSATTEIEPVGVDSTWLRRLPIETEAAPPAPIAASAPSQDPTVLDVTAVEAATASTAAATVVPSGGITDAHDDPEGSEPPDASDPRLGGVAAPDRTGAPTHTTVVTAAPEVPGARTLERVLAAQLVERVGELRDGGDGDYELSLQLDPADLGRLELRVRLEGGVVHVQVGAQSTGTTDLLRRALPELREALVEAGLTAGFLDVGTHTGGPGHRHDRGDLASLADRDEPDAPALRASGPASTPTVPVRAGADRGVDVLL